MCSDKGPEESVVVGGKKTFVPALYPWTNERYVGAAAKTLGLEIVPTGGDGNCAFSAISASTGTDARTLRAMARTALLDVANKPGETTPPDHVTNLAALAAHARAELTGLAAMSDVDTVKAYAEHIGTAGRFGTSVELSILASKMGRLIYVLEAYKDKNRRVVLGPAHQNGLGPIRPDPLYAPLAALSPEPIILLHRPKVKGGGAEHFDALVPSVPTRQ